jgi:hypothetical protein
MPIVFNTKNLNERLYKRMIENILLNLGIKVYPFLQEWTINLHDLKNTDTRFYEHVRTTSGQRINPDMPSGVTGKFVIDLYLHDDDNTLKTRENGDRIQHEICHAALLNTPDFVKGVHDNVNNRFQISFWYWRKIFWSRFYMTVIDIRPLLDV